jgi:hypothetical protein
VTEPPSTEELLASGTYGPDDWDPLFDRLDRGDFYDREGRSITMRQWGILHSNVAYVRVAEDKIGPYWISTVWLGVNHGIFGPPLIFETMVFGGGESHDCVRYSSLERAQTGHRTKVSEVRLFAELEQ